MSAEVWPDPEKGNLAATFVAHSELAWAPGRRAHASARLLENALEVKPAALATLGLANANILSSMSSNRTWCWSSLKSRGMRLHDSCAQSCTSMKKALPGKVLPK
eukprot:1144236-Pelagomonas_calceolata.AAC.1